MNPLDSLASFATSFVGADPDKMFDAALRRTGAESPVEVWEAAFAELRSITSVDDQKIDPADVKAAVLTGCEHLLVWWGLFGDALRQEAAIGFSGGLFVSSDDAKRMGEQWVDKVINAIEGPLQQFIFSFRTEATAEADKAHAFATDAAAEFADILQS
jgi:hypothetical protein